MFGTLAVIDVGELTVKVVFTPRSETAVAPVKFAPVSVTWEPTGPEVGAKLEIVGALAGAGIVRRQPPCALLHSCWSQYLPVPITWLYWPLVVEPTALPKFQAHASPFSTSPFVGSSYHQPPPSGSVIDSLCS